MKRAKHRAGRALQSLPKTDKTRQMLNLNTTRDAGIVTMNQLATVILERCTSRLALATVSI